MTSYFDRNLFGFSANSPAVISALRRCGEPQAFCKYVDRILGRRETLCAIAERSFPHPLGFSKIVLAQSQTGAKLRLHVWSERSGSEERGDIHDHFWNFSSVVITGSLRMEEYEVSPVLGETYHHYRLHPLAQGRYREEYLKKKRLKTLDVRDLKIGDMTIFHHTRIHATFRASNQLAATLVFQEPPTARFNNIFARTRTDTGAKIVTEVPFEPEKLSHLLHRIAGALSLKTENDRTER